MALVTVSRNGLGVLGNLQRLVQPFDRSILPRLQMMRRASNVPDLQHPERVLEGLQMILLSRIRMVACGPKAVFGLLKTG
jgi:hypothetical protein